VEIVYDDEKTSVEQIEGALFSGGYFVEDVIYPEEPLEREVYPIADAGEDISVIEGETVQLDAFNSSALESQIVKYQWTQTSGPKADLSDYENPAPFFKAAEVDTDGAELIFELTVENSDGLQDFDVIVVTIFNNDTPDVADDNIYNNESDDGSELDVSDDNTAESDDNGGGDSGGCFISAASSWIGIIISFF